ncbi:MAG: FecR family protein [Methylovulum sp.]|nr:FecR family protein [Methylovulum sp.]
MIPTNEDQPSPTELEELIDEQAVSWFVRLRSSSISREKKASFTDWLQQNPEHQKAFDEICLLWGDTQLKKALGETELERPKKPRHSFQWPLFMAASLVLLLVFRTDIKIFLQADYVTDIGKQQRIRLDDGSHVTLNTDSAITVNLKHDQRLVELLKGEAFFDVEPDADRPFIVDGSHSSTRVLGTRFFVHENDNGDEVNVLSGRVEVSNKHHREESVILHDDDNVSVNRMGLSKTNNPKLATSWLDGYLVFQDVALTDAIAQIQRYRNGVVVFRDTRLKQFRINGRISLHDPKLILEALEKTLPIKVTHLTDWLVIIG